ncbi:STT3 subunit of Oligosaccharyl transferase [Wallemia mellicola]|uniref:dolichyl-diphosphooligosaccharide--protein glycotransferase n=1 Tax=Wallemia mellicola TaxID=1708541 RepID=A0A4T0M036_9BASI|nr:STT3 subunit of Oligosaccharyl transferase [Wallemia mellicola]
MSANNSETVRSLLKLVILVCIAGAAVSSRLFSVIRHESIIHEFDPWFNFRATKVLVSQGFRNFWNWYDNTSWYPLGRATGGTLYPDIRNICVLLAPAFSGLTAYVTYLFTAEVKDERAGLLAAVFIGIVPGYISRSVAGSYDNEAIAIFLLMFTFYLWVKSLRLGSAFWGAITALAYYYMVSAWGGYAFIINIIPLHVFTLILMGRYSPRLYISYCSFYTIGTLASMQVPFVGFNPVGTADHMAALGVFGLLQLVAFTTLVHSHLPSKQQFETLLKATLIAGSALGIVGMAFASQKGIIAPWTGRFYSLWDTGYAKVHIPIVASVSEHQPTSWPSFFFDLQMLIYLFPAGVYFCFRSLSDHVKGEASVFVIIYSLFGSYFASVMVRLMLTLTPIVCVASAVALSTLLDSYIQEPAETEQVAQDTSEKKDKKTKKDKKDKSIEATHAKIIQKIQEKTGIKAPDARLLVIVNVLLMLVLFVFHSTWVTSNAYSSPSVVLASKTPQGDTLIIDDFREAYNWLNQTTSEDAVVGSWWDYGYQLAGMAGRTTLVDNNTWNNTHIATVGKIMASPEEVSYDILRKHDVTHLLVVFGGLLGYSGDDINKFLWMVRIAEGIWPDEIHERDYFTPRGEFRMDEGAAPAMKNSLLYKMVYHKFADLFGSRPAVDRVRQVKLPKVGPELDSLDEAFTSENWLVRIYEVKEPDFLGRSFKDAKAFNEEVPTEASTSSHRLEEEDLIKVLNVDVEIRQTKDKGRGLFARRDLKPGHTVLSTIPTVIALDKQHISQFCSYTAQSEYGGLFASELGTMKKLARCSLCKTIFYASKEAQKSDWPIHKNECLCLRSLGSSSIPQDSVRALARFVWMKDHKRTLGDNEWGQPVEDMYDAYDNYTEEQKIGLGNKAKEFFDFFTQGGKDREAMSRYNLSISYIMRMLCKIQTNGFALSGSDFMEIGTAICPLAACINHNQEYNSTVLFTQEDNRLSVVAFKGIEKGDEITTTYVDGAEPWDVQRNQLLKQYLFDIGPGPDTDSKVDAFDQHEGQKVALKLAKPLQSAEKWMTSAMTAISYMDDMPSWAPSMAVELAKATLESTKAILPYGHPVRGLMLVELSKQMLANRNEEKGTSEQTVVKKLTNCITITEEALAEVKIGYGKGSYFSRGLEKQLQEIKLEIHFRNMAQMSTSQS